MSEATIFAAALEKSDPAERTAYLAQACGDDARLRRRVEALLRAHAEPDEILDAPAPHNGTVDYAPITEKPGSMIGPYKLKEQIGEGGFGLVFVAEQTEPVKRKVALKVIKPGMDTREVMARFTAERQALALMDHPNIARVLDAGATDSGRPYFVMELVRGIPITEYCDQNQLSPRDRLDLFVTVCQAIQHAHQKGIIHRDIKPSNVLVTSHDGKPVAKVIDFGVAKAISQQLTDRSIYTNFAQMIGTPLYMSPEQAEMSGLDIDTRSDVYSLGVLLYELLTGSTPIDRKRFAKAAYDEIRRMIREDEPQKPSTRLSTSESIASVAAQRQTVPAKLSKLMCGDLDWITMKALEKDRARRYETANGLARDIQRYLDDEPVEACPPSASYRVRKFVQRNRPQVIAASLVLLALVAGVTGTTIGFFRASAEATKARAAEAETAAQLTKTLTAEAAASAEAANARKAEATAVSREKEEKKARETAEAVANFMREVFAQGSAEGQASPTREVNRDLTVKAAMDHAAKSIAGKFKDRPDIEAGIRITVGKTYTNLAAYPEAEDHLKRALRLQEEALGPDHLLTLATVNILGNLFLHKGDFAAAASLYKRALAGYEKVNGPDHPGTLTTVSNLAELFRLRADYAAAEPLYKRALAGYEKVYGTDHPETLTTINNLALLYDARADYAAAEPLSKRALAGCEKVHGTDHPFTIASVNNLAMVYQAKADYAAAEPLFKRALAWREKAQGPDHPETLKSVSNLASLYGSMRRLDEAIPLQEDALRRMRKVLGEDHPDMLTVSANLGVSYRDAGRADEAVPLLERAYAARRRYPGLNTHTPDLHDAYVRAGRQADAIRLAGEYLADARKSAPLGSPQLGTQLAFAGRMNLVHDPVAAEQLLRESLAIREKTQPDAWNTFNVYSLIGRALLDQKKYAEAEPLLLKGYEGMKAREKTIPASGAIYIPAVLDRLVELYTATNKTDEVKKWQAERAKYPNERGVK